MEILKRLSLFCVKALNLILAWGFEIVLFLVAYGLVIDDGSAVAWVFALVFSLSAVCMLPLMIEFSRLVIDLTLEDVKDIIHHIK